MDPAPKTAAPAVAPPVTATATDPLHDAGRRAALKVAALVLLLGMAFVGARLLAHGGDATAFISAGDHVTDPAGAPTLTVKEDSDGYDGQYFHRLARDPFTQEAREFGTRLDRPAYRHQRIGYPLLVWAVTGGRADLVPAALIAVNLVALGGLAYGAARLAIEAGRPAQWGLVAAGWPGLIVALSYDLSEVLAASLLMATILAIRRGRWPAATALLLAAGATRETALILAVAIVAAAVLRCAPFRRWSRALTGTHDGPPVPLVVGLVPLAAAAAFRVFLTAGWSDVPTTGADIPSFVGVPFLALVRQLAAWVGSADAVDLYQFFQLVVVLAVLATLARGLWDTGAGRPHERLALVGALTILAMVPVWDRSVVFLRWPTEAVIFGFAVMVDARRVPIRQLLEGVGALAATTALVWISI